ncbi:MAG: succinylglutamate desuccinylase/aspartoacylase family protein [Synergistaceae bacterium]|uniref:succinylglutamate desuccinylase/aspartoacylase family protein n=1 Tax=Aminivibrio sp. TaxID=1872489 RepID=UPI002A1E165B|nr:succinylglutamate desuccinylase/aspartoacylase family protein [Synergistaceae bacterium]MDD3390033.1 succinylglutamate desuccinylase/aspartoacylase family protein [Synergistaceae bacterium]MDD3688449.1 succinylglutamate desuccinylase/aspartoacylase family protein [Synergistaceae bacterium]MDD4020405.1 succinylglutamate desuccinylase/aspartoacylase family protein [Synergistaceae bacterium]MDD4613166.1 succinylglutamate desuccinylase/aspartoacylase family protein [Synergistaceae bacterium]
MKLKGTPLTAALLLILALGASWLAGMNFRAMWKDDVFVPAPGFEKKMLSDWFDGIRNTPADTPVYIQEGETPGGTVFIMGGTHPTEPSSMVTATLFLETAKVTKGRLIVVPQANIMGFSHNSPQEGHPQSISFTTADGGKRVFRFGSRLTNTVHEWPSPDIYIHPASGQQLPGKERGNLNRCYPGVPDGSLTERLAYALTELVRKENVDLAFDLHEASPEYPVVNAIVAHERSMELAAMAAMDLEMKGITMRLEPSPKNLRGLTHREWGDYTETMPILMETGNPVQGRLRGRTNEKLALTGEDKAYVKAFGLGRLYIPYDGKQTMEYRVGRHADSILSFLDNLDLVYEEQGVLVEGVPGMKELEEKGVGSFLSPVK